MKNHIQFLITLIVLFIMTISIVYLVGWIICNIGHFSTDVKVLICSLVTIFIGNAYLEIIKKDENN